MIRRHPRLALFTLSYLLAAAWGLFATGNREFLLYFVQMLLLIGLIAWADQRARFSSGVLWGLSVWGLLHMAGGLVPVSLERAEADPDETSAVLYSFWLIRGVLKYDHVVHAFGFFMATLACAEAMRRYVRQDERRTLAFYLVLACAGMGLGAVNEIVEFTATVMFPENNVGGYVNNSLDLVCNGIGAVLAAASSWVKDAKLVRAGKAGSS